ncbi:hypothetical protein CPB86DRAFT_840617 [Serendipita vermifera]|nr:hypothetical protein CPB86DRAFT_840617 [Serendipita vermifera]
MRSFVALFTLVLSASALVVRDNNGDYTPTISTPDVPPTDGNYTPTISTPDVTPTCPTPEPPPTCPPPTNPQVCSRCPPTDKAGHPLQSGRLGSHYTYCSYQDTDCHYGPNSEGDHVFFSYPAGACTDVLIATETCVDVTPPTRQKITTTCPDYNHDYTHQPLRNQIPNNDYVQCHYATSECYYDKTSGLLVTPPSIPVTSYPTTPADGVCPPHSIPEHDVYVS